MHSYKLLKTGFSLLFCFAHWYTDVLRILCIKSIKADAFFPLQSLHM